jgi:hypothetical protein
MPEYATLFGCIGLFLLVTCYNVYVGIKNKISLYDWLYIIALIAAVAMVMVIPVWASLVELGFVL